MEGQIRRGGVWADDLKRPIVARVFFELPDGTYHPGMFVASLHDALRLVLEYGLTVPRAFVTLHDEVILDVKEGVVDFPDDVQPLFDEAKARLPSWNIRWLEPGNLGNWTRSQCAKLVGAAQTYAKASGFDGSTPEAYDHRVNRLEHELQSVAAQYGFDLYRFGYQVPGWFAPSWNASLPITHTLATVFPRWTKRVVVRKSSGQAQWRPTAPKRSFNLSRRARQLTRA